MRSSALLSLLAGPFAGVLGVPVRAVTSAIVTTKVTPSYWRATFSDPPFNIQDTSWYEELYGLIDDIANDPDVKVVVFDSTAKNDWRVMFENGNISVTQASNINTQQFWIAHFDIINSVPEDLLGAVYWGNITRLANLPVLTVAAIRGIARGGGAELAAALDVRFGSKEKAILGQPEVGLGSLPGGGGLRLLPRLTGRGRTLEIVVGADDLDADTAALYGWINRAIPDKQFDQFVDKFARRVASWDHYAITMAKKIINGVTGFPTAEEVASDYSAYQAAFGQGVVAQRAQALIDAGIQTNEKFEINADEELLKFAGNGPWNSG